MAIPFLACMALAASVYQLPPRVLPAIQAVEGGRVGLASPNRDGSEDLGVMQINTLWLGPVARVTGSSREVVRARLLNDPCFNIAVAGMIFRSYLDEAKGDLMTAVGYYHSHTPARHEAYRDKVVGKARVMFAAR